MLVKELLNEATRPGRAWSGNLKRLINFLPGCMTKIF